MKGFHLFLGTIAILSSFTLCIAISESPRLKGDIPESPEVSRLLTSIQFTSTPAQRELMAKLNGMKLDFSSDYLVVSPASEAETALVCAEMQFALPVQVVCNENLLLLSTSQFVSGTIVMHSWFRRPKSDYLQRQEFLELGLLLTKGEQDLVVPFGSDVKLRTSIKGEDQSGGVAQ